MNRLLASLLLFATFASAQAQTLSPAVKAFVSVDAPAIALAHVRVIDGTGASAREDQTVVISQGKIQSVGDAAPPADVAAARFTRRAAAALALHAPRAR
ncbi:MAG: hypothetical protein ABSG52_09875 [Terriglobales bacterium]|jgi:ribosomal protein L18E